MKLNVYDSYLTYDELKPAIDKILKKAGEDRYLEYRSIGKSVEGRDMHFVVLAKDEEAVEEYLEQTLPDMLNNPAKLQAKIAKGKMKDYKVPVWFNNIHPDEAPGPDAIMNLLEMFALRDQVTYKTTEGGTEQDVTIDVDQALDNVIFLFNFTENPDGRYYNTRANVNGFDLNRDNAYQTQVETQAAAREISRWSPLSFLDFHGFVKEFLIEPCTPPHDPNYEYDVLMDGMIEQANLMGKAGVANTKYDNYLVPLYDYGYGWDDATPSYTATYAMHHGSLGHTIEIPELNQDSVDALVYSGLASTKFVLDNKNRLFNNQLEYFRRGVAGEDNTAVDQWMVNVNGEQVGRPRGTNANFFPEYYVLPVDKKIQKNPLEAYKMVEYLLRNGIIVEETTKVVKTGNVTYPKGSFIVPMHQAKRGLANTVLYDGVDVSEWPEMYAEIVMNFQDLRGFNRDEIRTAGAFDGKTKQVDEIRIPSTKITGNAANYVILNSNVDAVKAVNRLLAEGKTVNVAQAVGGGYKAGDYVVTKSDLEGIKRDFLLDVVPFDNGSTIKTLVQPKVAASNNGQITYVLKELGFNIVSDLNTADVLVDDSGRADLAAGKSYIGIGGRALRSVKLANLLPGFDYANTDFYHEGLLRADLTEDSITAGYGQNELLYSASGSWISAVPAGAKVLAAVSNDSNYFKTGWWPGHELVQGQTLAITQKVDNVTITLFANNLNNKAHPQNEYRLLANAIFASMPN